MFSPILRQASLFSSASPPGARKYHFQYLSWSSKGWETLVGRIVDVEGEKPDEKANGRTIRSSNNQCRF